MDILVLYYSVHGSVRRMAELVAEGIEREPGAQARLRTVPRVAPVLARAARHLKPGGLLFVAEIHPDMLRDDLGGHFERDGVTFALPSHPHDRAEFETALSQAGFAEATFDEMRADDETIAAIPKFAKRAGSGVLLGLRARRA